MFKQTHTHGYCAYVCLFKLMLAAVAAAAAAEVHLTKVKITQSHTDKNLTVRNWEFSCFKRYDFSNKRSWKTPPPWAFSVGHGTVTGSFVVVHRVD